MKNLVLICLLLSSVCFSQTKEISGLVLDELLYPVPGTTLKTPSGIYLGTSDIKGRFSIKLDEHENFLEISSIGYETTEIEISSTCTKLEIILMEDSTYCFMTEKKANRLRRKRFEKLDEIFDSAISKNIFTGAKCYKMKLKYI